MKKSLLLLFCFISVFSMNAQYVNTVLNNNNFFDINSAIPSSSGGFVVRYARMASSSSTLLKLDASGNVIYNVEYNQGNIGSICETNTGSVIAFSSINAAVIMSSYDNTGTPLWRITRNLTGVPGSLNGIVAAEDGSGAVFLSGASSSDSIFIGKVDVNGSLLYVKAFDINPIVTGSSFSNSFPKSIFRTTSGDFLALIDVSTNTPNATYQVVVKFNSLGTVLLVKYFSSDANLSNLSGGDIMEASNGDILLTSNLYLNGVVGSGLIRLSSSGNLIWAKHIANQSFGNNYISQQPNGELTLGVYSHNLTPDNVTKSSFIHLSSTGNVMWCRNFGGTGTNQMHALSSNGSGFISALIFYNAYSSPGGIGVVSADILGNMIGCFDVINTVPISTITPTMTSMAFAMNNVVYSLPNPNPPGTTPGLVFTKINPNINIANVVTPPLCFGGFGNINLTLTNGYTPYVYNWSNGTSNQNLLNVLGGSYTVRVSDSKGCVKIDTFAIASPAQLAATYTVSHVTCFGSQNGSINLTTNGGTPGYTYQWTTNDVTEDLSGISGGFYQLTITDANNCTKIVAVSVNEPQQLIAGIISSQNVTCNGFCNGSLTGIASGGTTPYTYLWNNAGATTTTAVTALCPGNYLFSVTDAKNCQTFSNAVITEPTALVISTSGTSTTCGDSTGSASAAVTGGVMPYSYMWSNSVVNDTITNLQIGTYTINVTDFKGCTISSSANVGVTTLPQNLCMLTVDTNNKNVVIWEKPAVTNIDGYNVYRNIAGLYSVIAYVPYDSLSQYVDLTFGVDPNVTAYRYEVAAVDTCGNVSATSAFHQTIHLTTNVGLGGVVNLIWDNYQGFPFTYNRILRDSTGTGNWQVVDSVASTNFTWTDLAPPTSGALYLIEVVTPGPCNPTMRLPGNNQIMAISKSRSNIKNNRTNTTGISTAFEDQLAGLKIYPNPATDEVNIIAEGMENGTITLVDMTGHEINKINTNGTDESYKLSLDEVNPGMYFVRLLNSKGEYKVRKLIVE